MKLIYSHESMLEDKNRYILTHWQKGMELLRVTKGSLQCLINGKEFQLQTGDICLINQDQLHRIYCLHNADCRFQCLLIDPALFTSHQEIYDLYIAPVLNDESFTHIISSSKKTFTKEVTAILEAIENLETNKPKAHELLLVAFLHMLFQKLYMRYSESYGDTVYVTDYELLLYRKLADYIYQHYDQKITLEELASAGNISRNRCCSIFKKYAQHSPIDFLNMYRLERSTALLTATSESIASIALSCGFGQQSYYNRLFLRRYGTTPKEYRTQHQKL